MKAHYDTIVDSVILFATEYFTLDFKKTKLWNNQAIHVPNHTGIESVMPSSDGIGVHAVQWS